MFILYPLFFLFVGVFAQNNNTVATQEDPTLQKPAGLPNVDWDILKVDPNSRGNLCARQIAYCANNCGGPSEASKNFCNTTSMAWGCGCKQKSPDFTPFLWPVVQAECSGKLQACQIMCNNEQNRSSTCATTCNAYYQCGTEKSPPSYLQIETESDAPSYNGPPAPIQNNANTNSNGGSGGNASSSSGQRLSLSTQQVVLTVLLACAPGFYFTL